MDESSKALLNEVSKRLRKGGDGQKATRNCLQNACQSEMNKCRGRQGPCRPHPIRMASRRNCKHIRDPIFNNAEGPCITWCNNTFAKHYGKKNMKDDVKSRFMGTGLDPQQGASNPEEDYKQCIKDCKNKAAENSVEFQTCFNTTLLNRMADCMLANCSENLKSCAEKRCKLDFVLS